MTAGVIAAGLLAFSVPASAACGADGAPAAPEVHTTSLSLEQWGLPSAGSIRFGELALVETDQGFDMYPMTLRTNAPPGDGMPSFYRRAPRASRGSFLVDNFGRSGRNRLGGRSLAFERPPSSARVSSERTEDGRPALVLAWDGASEGWAGVAVQLFLDAGEGTGPCVYLDARNFSALGFWIRGEEGGERLTLKLADREWQERDDAMSLGPLTDYLPSGRVETRWQRAVVPLDSLPRRLDPGALATLVLQGASAGPHRVFLTGLSLAVDSSRLASLPEPLTEAETTPFQRATWIWNTRELLADSAAWRRALDFLVAQRFDRAYLQIPSGPGGRAAPERLAPLVRDLSGRGIVAYALDGGPRQALPENHARVLQSVRAVLDYNRSAPRRERFVGLRHDIEPYILPGFGGEKREEILGAYLDLIARVSGMVRDAGLIYALDIPSWYDARSPLNPQGITLDFRGSRRPLSEHLLALADEVAIMAYRTSAYGADGVVGQAREELVRAATTGTSVYVALETTPLPDEEDFRFRGEPVAGGPRPPGPGDWVGARVRGDAVDLALVEAGGRWEGRGEVLWWKVENRVTVPASKLTFAELGSSRLAEVIREVQTELGSEPAFAGVAVHHLGSLMRLRR